ncbi:hypothetical protein HGG72_05490 [Ochrobactrum pecoris]|nr:hypothetical protein [Brucella pecoris]
MPTQPSQATAEGMPKNERPIDRVTRLSYELCDALDEYADGTMMAAITPRSRSVSCPVLFWANQHPPRHGGLTGHEYTAVI